MSDEEYEIEEWSVHLDRARWRWGLVDTRDVVRDEADSTEEEK